MNTVRNAVAVIRYDWFGARVGGPDANMRGQWLTLIVSIVLVFGCFFAIGRMRAGAGSQGEGSAALPAFSERAAIPDALRGASPAAGAVPSAIAAPPPPPTPTPRVASARDARAAEAARSFAAEASRTATPSTGAPVESAPAPEPVPTEAKTPSGSQGGSSSPSHGGSAGGGATGTHPSGGGGSFDSSE